MVGTTKKESIKMKHNLAAEIDKRHYNLQLRLLGTRDFEKKLIDYFLNSLCNRIDSMNMLLNPLTDDIPNLVDSVFVEWNPKAKELNVYIDKLNGGDYEATIGIQQLHNHYRSVAQQIRKTIKSL